MRRIALVLSILACAFCTQGQSFFRLQGWVQTPEGAAVPGASVAICSQPATTNITPCSPLASLYAASSSNTVNVTGASYATQQITFTLASIPSDVVAGSYISVNSVNPTTYNGVWLISFVSGLQVTISNVFTNPGTYSSGGTVATSALPNPLQTDGNGYYFAYVATNPYTIQVYDPVILTQVYKDQYPFSPNSGGGGGSGTTITVNAASVTSPLNINNTTPAPDAGYNAVIWKYSSGSLLGEYQPGGGGGGGANPCFSTPNSLQFGSSSTAFGCASNFTWSGGNLAANQFSNGQDTIAGARFTDTSPTGYFWRFVNNANTQNLGYLDVNGNLFASSSETIGNSSNNGTVNVGQSGTLGLQTIHGGSGANNTNPACAGLTTSPNDALSLFICVSSLGYPFLATGSPASADSANVLSPDNGVVYLTGTYTVSVPTDRKNWFVMNCASACNFNLPVATSAGAPSGWSATIINLGAGNVSVTPTGPSTINGTSVLTVTTNSGTSVKSDGVGNYAANVGGSGGGGGGVSSVGLTVPAGSIFGVTGSPVTSSGSLGLTTIGNSGGIPCFTSSSVLSASSLFPAGSLLLGGGSGACPTTASNFSFSSNTFTLPSAVTMFFANVSGDTLVSSPTTGLTFSAPFTAQSFVGGSSGAAAYDFFGQGTAPGSFNANGVTFYAPTSVTTYGVIWPSTIGTANQSMQITGTSTVAGVPVATMGWAGSAGTVNSCSTVGAMAYYASTGTAISCLPSVLESAGNVTVGVPGSQAGSVSIAGATSGTDVISVPATSGSWTFVLPSATPTVNQNVFVSGITGSTVTLGYQNNGGGGGSGCVPSGSANQILLDSGSGSCTDSTATLASGALVMPSGGSITLSNSSQTGSFNNAPCTPLFSTTDTLTNSVTTPQFFATNCEIPANSLKAGKVLIFRVGADMTVPASGPTITFYAYLCTVSGCATGSKILIYQSITAVPGSTTTGTSGGAEWMLQGQASPGSSVAISSSILTSPDSGSTNSPFTKSINATNVTGVPTNVNLWLSFAIQYSNTTNATSLTLSQLVTQWMF